MRQPQITVGLAALFAAAAFAVEPQPEPQGMPGLHSEVAPRDIKSTEVKSIDSMPVSGSSKEIQSYLTKFTNETVKSTDAMARVTDMLCKQDRERIHGQLQKDYPELQKLIVDFRQAWREKYNDGFDMGRSESEIAFAGSRVLQGEISDDAILASERLGPDAGARTGLEHVDKTADKVEDKLTGDKKLATVYLPAAKEQHLDPVTLRVVDEGAILTDWRLNCSDAITAQKLHDNLKARFNGLLQSKSEWPAEERDAYRIVSHQILAALTDQPLSATPKLDSRQTGLDVED